MIDKMYRYIYDVLNDKFPITKWVKYSIERHQHNIKDKKLEYFFDEVHANKFLELFEMQREGKSSTKNFVLDDFQAFYVGSIFGWKHIEFKFRRFSESLLFVPKKNGKTTKAAGCSTLSFTFDDMDGAEVYFAATTRKQAKKTFTPARNIMKGLVSDFPEDLNHIIVNTSEIHDTRRTGIMEAISKEADNIEGANTTFGVCDEIHLYKDSEIIDNIKNAMNKDNAHLMLTSTAGTNPYSYCAEYVHYCSQVIRGIIKNERLFAMLYMPDDKYKVTLKDGSEDYDWHNRDLWRSVNPGLGTIKSVNLIEREYIDASTKGGEKENDFKTKHLNIFVKSKSTWIKNDVWLKQGTNWDLKEIEGETMYIGIDLSKVSDITALIGFVPYKDHFKIYRKFYAPETKVFMDGKNKRSDGVNYLDWYNGGHINLTPGNTIDYEYIKNDLREMALHYNIPIINYDRMYHVDLVVDLLKEGFICNPFSQSPLHMNMPTMEIERLTHEGKLDHGNDPVLAWMCDNVVITTDSNGNRKMDKGKSGNKIDGMVALAMALSGYIMNKEDDTVITLDDLGIMEISLDEEE